MRIDRYFSTGLKCPRSPSPCTGARRPRPCGGVTWNSWRLAPRDQVEDGPVGRGRGLIPGTAACGRALMAIRPDEAVIDLVTRVFGLSVTQIGRRIKAATKVAGLGEGFTGHSPRVGMSQDLSAAGAERMTAGRWDSATMPARYTEAQAAGRGAVARYYQGGLRK